MKFRKLKASEIDCRISQIDKTWLTLLLYKDARVDMNILDETVGCLGWRKSYSRDNANCTVSIWDDERKQWVDKEDTGTESFSEAEKGLASDSFKRACFNWGIGRELYTAPNILITPKKDIKYRIKKGGDTTEVDEFYQKENGKYETKTRFWVEYIDYNNDGEIQNIIIRDQKNNVRFSKLTKEKDNELMGLDIAIQKRINSDIDLKEQIFDKYNVKLYEELLIKQKEEIVKEVLDEDTTRHTTGNRKNN